MSKLIQITDFKGNRYKKVNKSSDGLCLVENFEGLFGYLNDKTGDIQIPCQFPVARDFDGGKALVVKNGALQYIDPDGNFMPFRSEIRLNQNPYFNEGVAILSDTEVSSQLPIRKTVINAEGKKVFTLPDDYSFEANASFYGGVAPIGRFQKKDLVPNARTYERVPNTNTCFVDKLGKIYTDAKDVEALQKIYDKERNLKLFGPDQATYPERKVVIYCAEITYMGQRTILRANTPEELIEAKRKYFEQMATTLNTLQKDVEDLQTGLNLTRQKPSDSDKNSTKNLFFI